MHAVYWRHLYLGWKFVNVCTARALNSSVCHLMDYNKFRYLNVVIADWTTMVCLLKVSLLLWVSILSGWPPAYWKAVLSLFMLSRVLLCWNCGLRNTEDVTSLSDSCNPRLSSCCCPVYHCQQRLYNSWGTGWHSAPKGKEVTRNGQQIAKEQKPEEAKN